MSVIRIATYNIHSCIGTDSRFAPARIVDAIREIDADAIALQEVGWHHRGQRHFDQFHFFQEMTGYHVIQGPTKLHRRAHYGNALLSRKRPYRIRRLDLSYPMHIPRGAIIARLALEDGRSVTVINVHLGLSPWDRRRQVRILTRLLNRLTDPVILMGDMNSVQPQGLAFRRLSWRLPVRSNIPTFHSRMPTAALDRIYMSRQCSFNWIKAWHSPVTAKASDHLPLVAEVEIG